MKHCCRVGEGAGLHFGHESGKRTCPRHFTTEQAALIAELDERGTAVGLRRDDEGVRWPYGPNIDVPSRLAMLTWAEGLQLKKVTAHQALPCVCWPTSNRRSRCECGHKKLPFTPPDSTWDHITYWKMRNGKRAVLVFQPYQITEAGQAILDRWNERDDVHVEVRDDSWYGHGTKFIGIWNAQFAPPSPSR